MNNIDGIERAIKKVRDFVTELQFVEHIYFDGLTQELGLTDEGKDWMFDYIFNQTESETFSEYLKNYGKTFGELK